ncbi:hypothetical protein EYR40_006063 [Pleurotus pulmonarius]|nr:hypothetical protein EYR40_006063 [Pleurotus pulmonarius]
MLAIGRYSGAYAILAATRMTKVARSARFHEGNDTPFSLPPQINYPPFIVSGADWTYTSQRIATINLSLAFWEDGHVASAIVRSCIPLTALISFPDGSSRRKDPCHNKRDTGSMRRARLQAGSVEAGLGEALALSESQSSGLRALRRLQHLQNEARFKDTPKLKQGVGRLKKLMPG